MSRNRSNKKNSKYVNIYNKEQYLKDEDTFNKSVDIGKPDFSSFKRLFLRDLCINTKILDDGYFGNINLEDITFALNNPKKGWGILLQASEQLMKSSPHYYRLNSLYSNMALFCWGIDLYDVKQNANIDTIKKIYNNLAYKLEMMNVKHEFSKISKILPYQDIYCGLLIESQQNAFIQQINYKICKLYQVEDGLFNFAINLSSIDPKKLGAYPDFIQQAYLDYFDGKIQNWYIPPSDKQICIKLNSQWNYPYPMMISLVRDILDLDIYKKLKLQSARTDNYKAISIEVPIDSSTVDKPLLTPDTLSVFAEINRESMNDDIGIIYTLGSEGKAISFKDSSNTRNNVSDAIDTIYDSSGITKELYNGSSSATALSYSIENDSGFVYGLYRQFERWINRFIKLRNYNKSYCKFHFYLLDITIFNRNDVSNRYKDAIAFGTPVIDKYLASLDMTPSRVFGSYVLHKDIFDFNNNFVPLQTSYTSSSNNEGGRPTNASKGELLDVSGQQTEDGGYNEDR